MHVDYRIGGDRSITNHNGRHHGRTLPLLELVLFFFFSTLISIQSEAIVPISERVNHSPPLLEGVFLHSNRP